MFFDSQDREDSGGTLPQLRKVDCDDLEFSWTLFNQTRVQVQQLASATVSDGALHPELLSLRLKHNGHCPDTCHRDLPGYHGNGTVYFR